MEEEWVFELWFAGRLFEVPILVPQSGRFPALVSTVKKLLVSKLTTQLQSFAHVGVAVADKNIKIYTDPACSCEINDRRMPVMHDNRFFATIHAGGQKVINGEEPHVAAQQQEKVCFAIMCGERLFEVSVSFFRHSTTVEEVKKLVLEGLRIRYSGFEAMRFSYLNFYSDPEMSNENEITSDFMPPRLPPSSTTSLSKFFGRIAVDSRMKTKIRESILAPPRALEGAGEL
eukprot:TRINITY_DN5087_c0_g1_i2.p1 TRINITY_DN5087_c0_g1~~TRINITY_DN5087_c0_g1_i2.p1  ORF type:complete len:242 (-),score=54.00 TRINITY_DN5087_c0_g1_i2:1302-1991(-)